jgi:hypothetical protein
MARWLRMLAVAVVAVGCASAARAQEPRGSQGWNLALTGGFVTSGLTDPVYAQGTVPGRTTRVVVRQTDREDTASLGVGMFAQVYHDRLPWFAPLSLGLGIRQDGRATYYIGPALRFGPHASVTSGVAIGPVAALPGGVVEEQPISDSNLLLNLGSRTTHSWFLGLTYTFASLR